MTHRTIHISQPAMGEEEWLACRQPIESGWLTSGPQVQAFEELFAQIHQVPYAIAVTSATTALHLACVALGVGPGDEVIVPAFTWVSTANVVLYCGARPVFADIDPITFNLDPEDVKKRLSPRTKAIIAVHLFGLCADMDALRDVAGSVPIIEDAACAAGASYKGRMAGGLGVVGCFSFHPRKSVTTGEGGMCTTWDFELAERIRSLRNHGASISEEQRHKGPRPYILPEFNILGYNYRMTDLQAAVGLVQLKKMHSFIEERKRWAEYYIRELSAISWLRLPHVPEGYGHGWQSFVTTVLPDKAPMPRNDLMEYLQQRGISTRPGTHAVHMLGYYREKLGLQPEDYPSARFANDHSMAIPLHNRMTAEDFEYVVHTLRTLAT
ncbi:MAG: DegT/DnrJ/EryC1/StrS family aminotransferase [Flavobacteriales bacterium]|nr:DegT/DnrJ/EryC1/StrS family aminotransferase [Flavobacteriales bacterium]MCX7768455.1 DegT/DnrJ/EryC1/StrS family aminotransferase [Flavobacteriales bacterium]MDW8410645.1 DegT/DnrJ/EryC1/StrS family aminotransferase [Flavobacteriales bacterium]